MTGHSQKETSSLQICLCIAEISPEPPLLQAEESQLSLRGLPLDCLLYVHLSLALGSPELGTVLQLWPPQSGVEGKLPQFVASYSPYAAR